jgi:hypothetical protein
MRIIDLWKQVRAIGGDVQRTRRELDAMKLLLGQVLSELHREDQHDSPQDYEFRVFSQWGEDGIIQYLTRHINIPNRTFIEFGVEDFSESNCRFLLEKDNWQGYVLDGSDNNIRKLQASPSHWRHTIGAKAAFVTRENVNELLLESKFHRHLGILSIDVDGMDYHILEALRGWQPRILIVEYNAVFGAERAVTVPYEADFTRLAKHASGLYFGASLSAFVSLLDGRGYSLVGVNSAGNNAFFIQSELCNDAVPAVHVRDVFRNSTFRDSRDASGALTFLDVDARKKAIADMPLVDTLSGRQLRVCDLAKPL